MPREMLYFRHAALAAVLVAIPLFLARTFYQPHYTSVDFAVVYTATRAWLAGENPYAEQRAPTIWQEADGHRQIMWANLPEEFERRWLPILLIPPSLPLLVPFALFPASAATTLWAALGIVTVLAMWWALALLMGVRLYSTPALLLLAGMLLLAPLHECFVYAQPSLPSIGLIILGLAAAMRGADRSAGILLALATALKPQLGAAFVLFYLFSGRWRLIGTCAVAFLALSAVALAPMALRGTPWLATWLENLASAKAAGDINSASIEYSGRGHLLHLQVIIHGLTEHRLLANLLAMGFTAVLAAMFAVQWRRRSHDDVLLWASIVSVLAMLPMYHRLYDATLMAIPLAWAIMQVRARPRIAIPILLFTATFVIPHQALPRVVQALGADPTELSGPIWHAFVEPYRVWVLLIGYALLMRALAEHTRVPAPRQHTADQGVPHPAPAFHGTFRS